LTQNPKSDITRVLRTNVRGESANSRKDGEKAAKKAAKKWYIKISI